MLNLSLQLFSDANHLKIIINPDSYDKLPSTDHLLTQLIKDHFKFIYYRKHRNEPLIKLFANSYTAVDLLYTIDDNLSKPLHRFIDHLIPKISLITFYNGLEIKTYRYLGQEKNTLTFEQVKYNNDYNPVIKIVLNKNILYSKI